MKKIILLIFAIFFISSVCLGVGGPGIVKKSTTPTPPQNLEKVEK